MATGFGRMLSEAREARGLTLEQIERDTRIVRRYLVALEQEDLQIFPAEVYARGFLRSYASYLGLNPAELVALLPGQAPPEPPPPMITRPPAADDEPLGAQAAPQGRRLPALPSPPWLGPVVTAAALVAAAALLARFAGDNADPAALGTGRLTTGGLVARMGSGVAPGSGPEVAERMPRLTGLDEQDALAQLAALGITPFVIDVPSRDAPPGQVIRQSPGPAARVGTATVTIVVSRGG